LIRPARAQPHNGHHRAVFHGRWDDRTQRHFSRVWRRVRLGAAPLPAARLSVSATYGNTPATGRKKPPNDVRAMQIHPKQCRRRDIRARAAATASTASSERATTRPEARIARALRLSPAHAKRVRAVMAIGCRNDCDSDWCSDACQERASHARHAEIAPTSSGNELRNFYTKKISSG
jgi:hypothetical protein